MATHAHTTPALHARRRRRPAPLPAHLRHLVPVLHNRERIEAIVDHLLDLLDACDGDPDREEGDDAEPDQHGACEAHDDDPSDRPGQMYACRGGVGTPEDAEPDADDEPDMIPVTWIMPDGARATFMAQRFGRRAPTRAQAQQRVAAIVRDHLPPRRRPGA